MSWFSNAINTIKETGEKVGGAIGEKTAEGWEATKVGGKKGWEKTKVGANYIGEKTKEGALYVTDKGQSGVEYIGETNAWKTTKEGTIKGWEKTKEFTSNTVDKISGKKADDTPNDDTPHEM